MFSFQKPLDEACSILDEYGVKHGNIKVEYSLLSGSPEADTHKRQILLGRDSFFSSHKICVLDILHEVGHIWLDTRWYRFTQTKRNQWENLFGDPEAYWCEGDPYVGRKYTKKRHISEYASTAANEDFAEVFSYGLYRDFKPKKSYGKLVRQKLEFVEELIS